MQKALALGEKLPERPRPVPGRRVVLPANLHYRDEGYEEVLLAAIQARDLGMATAIEEQWRGGGEADGEAADPS